MAELHIVKTLVDNKYTIEVYIDNVTEIETALIETFGEPKVTFGGTIDVGTASNFVVAYVPETDAAFTVPVVSGKKIVSSFTVTVPYTYYEDGDVKATVQAASSKPLAEAMMNDLASHIERKITDSWTVFAAQIDNFSSSDTVVL